MKKQLLLLGVLTFGFLSNAQTLIESYSFSNGSLKGINGNGSDFSARMTADKNSIANGAVEFNGYNHANLGKPTIDATNGFAISFWYYPSSNNIANNTNNVVISKRDVCSSGNQLNIIHNATTKKLVLSVRVDAPSPVFTVSASVDVVDNTWQYVTFILDNTNHRAIAYLNASPKDIQAYSNANGVVKEFGPNSNLFLAYSPCVGVDGSVKFKGKIDELKLYASTLTTGQINSIYNESPLVPPAIQTQTLEQKLMYDDEMALNCANGYNLGNFGVLATDDREGNPLSAIEFDGTSSAVGTKRVGNIDPVKTLIDNFQNMAFSAWIKTNGIESNGFIMGNYAGTNGCGNSGHEKGIIFRLLNNKLNVYIAYPVSGLGYLQLTTDNAIPAGEWHHVVANIKQPLLAATDVEIFVDGVKQAVTNNSPHSIVDYYIIPSMIPTAIGGQLNTSNTVCAADPSFKGTIDQVKIFKDTLSDEQILTLSQENGEEYIVNGVTNDAFMAETFNTFVDSIDFAQKYNGEYDGVSFVEDRFGNPASAIKFDGSNAYINAGLNISSVVADGDAFSYSVWIKPASFLDNPMNNNMILGHSGDGGCENQRQQYFRILDQKVNFTAVFANNNGSNSRSYTGSTLIFDDSKWYHVVVNVNQPISDNNSVQIYVDGIRETLTVTPSGTVTTGNLPTNTSMLGFGNYLRTNGTPCNLAGDPSFKGAMDDIKIYDRALCIEDILALYNEESPLITGFSETASLQKESFVYPNPVENGQLNLTKSGSWSVLNLSGVNVLQGEGNQLNVSNLQDGMYIIRVSTQEGVLTNTFVKK